MGIRRCSGVYMSELTVRPEPNLRHSTPKRWVFSTHATERYQIIIITLPERSSCSGGEDALAMRLYALGCTAYTKLPVRRAADRRCPFARKTPQQCSSTLRLRRDLRLSIRDLDRQLLRPRDDVNPLPCRNSVSDLCGKRSVVLCDILDEKIQS